MEIREALQVTGRTLGEMHSGYVHALLLSEDDEERYCTQNFKELLAIAQGQREELVRRPRVGACVWNLAETWDDAIWSTTCQHEWQFLADGPSENDVKFCPFCGGEIEIDKGKQA